MKKFRIASVAVVAALGVLLPVSSAGASAPDFTNTATHLVAVASGQVNITSGANPDPQHPFVINSSGGNFGGLVLGGVFTAGGSAGNPVSPISACPSVVRATTNIPFTTVAQNFLTGYGSINGGGAFSTDPAVPSVCTVAGTIPSGAFVRAGTIAVAQFTTNLSVTAPVLGTATGSTVATFVGAAVPGGPPCLPTQIATCTGIAGPVAG